MHKQHGRAERSERVLTSRAIKLKLANNLLDYVWPEIYKTAGYLLNRFLSRRLRWKSSIFKLLEWLGRTDPLLKCHYLKPYGCRAYAFIYNRPKLLKLAIKAYIRYIVEYLFTNIWKIWILILKRVIAMRDVTFDTIRRYKPEDNRLNITDKEAIALKES